MDVVPIEAIHLVLDVDAEVARLGYGDKDFRGMEILQAAAAAHGLTVNHHPGIRIGLTIADDITLIYSPTPELIETENRQSDKPNGVVLYGELPASLGDACAVGGKSYAKLEVGLDPVDKKKVEIVKKNLQEHPPKAFNIARIERAFSSMLCFVELRIEDYKLTSRSLILDPKLFGVRKAEVVQRLTNRYRLFAKTDSLTVEIPAISPEGKTDPTKKVKFGPDSVDEERRRIKKRYIIEAGDFGLVILRKDIEEFKKEIEALKKKVDAYKKAVQEEIKKRTKEVEAELLAALKDSLKANPPEDWRKRFAAQTPTDADIKRLFEEEIRAQVDRANAEFNPRVFYTFKDITYRTFHDEKFRKLLEKTFGEESIDSIFREYDVAPEQNRPEKRWL